MASVMVKTGPYSEVRLLTHQEYVTKHDKCASMFHHLWCFEKPGHRGDHWALDTRPSMRVRKVYWRGTGLAAVETTGMERSNRT